MTREELILKAKEAKSAEELLALAKENGMEMTEEEANAYFAQLNPVSGELSDDELDNVAGGGCHASDGRLITTIGNNCSYWRCEKCYKDHYDISRRCDDSGIKHLCHDNKVIDDCCNNCYFCSYEGGTWYCNHSKNKN